MRSRKGRFGTGRPTPRTVHQSRGVESTGSAGTLLRHECRRLLTRLRPRGLSASPKYIGTGAKELSEDEDEQARTSEANSALRQLVLVAVVQFLDERVIFD